jgi:hypothetical protein
METATYLVRVGCGDSCSPGVRVGYGDSYAPGWATYLVRVEYEDSYLTGLGRLWRQLFNWFRYAMETAI